MVFNSYLFLMFFLPAVWLGYWYILPTRAARHLFLLAASLAFYAYAGVCFLILLLAMTAVTYVAARYFLTSPQPLRRKFGLALGLSSLLILALFKYSGSLESRVDQWGLSFLDPVFELTFPLGLSFYTFNLIGYLLDVNSRQIEPASSPLHFLTYISFFPAISSGPLIRYKAFGEQLAASLDQKRPTAAAIEQGTFSLIIGLSKKLIIADYLADQINPFFTNYEQLGFWGAWLVILAFTYQIYFDFSGYSDIAIGVAQLLGITLPQNFNAPYTSRNITEFWQRWHMTLSGWFRERLFFPLSRYLLKNGPVRSVDATRSISLVITMLLIGWWHGANWPFILWGINHGILLALHAHSRARRWPSVPPLLARAATFLVVVLGWVTFRAGSTDMMISLYSSLFGLNGFGTSELAGANVGVTLVPWLVVLFVVTNLPRDTAALRPRLSWSYAAVTALLLVLCLLMIGHSESFLYFQF